MRGAENAPLNNASEACLDPRETPQPSPSRVPSPPPPSNVHEVQLQRYITRGSSGGLLWEEWEAEERGRRWSRKCRITLRAGKSKSDDSSSSSSPSSSSSVSTSALSRPVPCVTAVSKSDDAEGRDDDDDNVDEEEEEGEETACRKSQQQQASNPLLFKNLHVLCWSYFQIPTAENGT